MIKFIERTKIVYEVDNLPYIHIDGMAENTIAILEIEFPNGKKNQYFIDESKQISPFTMLAGDTPKATIIIIVNSTEFVRTNSVLINDWDKFIAMSQITPEMKIAQLERRIKDLETKPASIKADGSKQVGAVLTMCEGGRPLFQLPYGFAAKVINGKKPDQYGVIELKMSDMKDLVTFSAEVLALINNLNSRVEEIEKQVNDILHPVL